MSLKKYLSEITSVASETGLYTPLASHIFGAILGYPPHQRVITKPGTEGVPDIRLYSQEDDSQWAVTEVKIDDDEIRNEAKRTRIWKQQIEAKGYIEPDTFYVVLCAPRTFYICDLEGKVLEALHIETAALVDPRTRAEFPLNDQAFRDRLHIVSYAASLERKQFEAFRRGELRSGYIELTTATLPQLHFAFSDAIEKLRGYCLLQFRELRSEYEQTKQVLSELDKKLDEIGSGAIKTRERLLYRRRSVRAKHRAALGLFDDDYERFKHDQTYAGTQEERNFEDIFCTNTAYIVLSRLIFVRICEDVGLTTRKISNSGIATWRKFVQNIKDRYQDLLEVAFRDVSHIYSSVFESSVFDWFGTGNGQLHDILERILFRLNAFNFKGVNRDLLGTIYQYFRPKVERKRLGEYYTPVEVVDYILARAGISSDPDLMQKQILDPACGSFTFGARSTTHLLKVGSGLSNENKIELIRRCVAGYDINPFSVFLSHLSLLFGVLDLYLAAKKGNQKYEIAAMNVAARNSLTFGIPSAREIGEYSTEQPDSEPEAIARADYVVGNPPFVRNERLPEEDRTVLEELYGDLYVRNTDLSAFFLYASAKYFVKQGGVIGMVAPVAIANAQWAAYLRETLSSSEFEVYEVVSLEWCAKQLFPGADIIPMLVFIRKRQAARSHPVRLVRSIESPQDLTRCLEDKKFLAQRSSHFDFSRWSRLSPIGDWCLDISEEDAPIIEELNRRKQLNEAATCSFGIKSGNDATFLRPADGHPKTSEVPFVKGQHVAAFQLSREVDEYANLNKIDEADDPAIWDAPEFYQTNIGKADATGMGRTDYRSAEKLAVGLPSDTLCCLLPEISVTLAAAVIDPLSVAANNSVLVVVPRQFSAYCLAAILNSRTSRYYSFLTLRSAILLRRRTTWFPRAIKALPFPELTNQTARKLHELAVKATELSSSIKENEIEMYLAEARNVKEFSKAGFLGLRIVNAGERVDREDLMSLDVTGRDISIGQLRLSCSSANLLTLVRISLLASEKDEFTAKDIEDALVPSDEPSRAKLAKLVREFDANSSTTERRVAELLEEIDDIVAAGLGLKPSQHSTIRKRCLEFPLSVTVERPRFVWSADRKRQARRVYKPGQRFK